MKPLYFKRYNPSMRDESEPDTWEPFESIKSEIQVENLAKGCPKCECKDLEIIKVL